MVTKLLLWTWQNSQSWSDTPVWCTFINCTMSHSAHLFHISITIIQYNLQTQWGYICPILTHSTIIRQCKWLKSPTFFMFTSRCVTDKLTWMQSCSGGTKTVTSLTPGPCKLSYKTCIKTHINKTQHTNTVEIPRPPPFCYTGTPWKIKSIWYIFC